ncbi:hypothetical protein ACROYT_G012841 [Oculina patagonica]
MSLSEPQSAKEKQFVESVEQRIERMPQSTIREVVCNILDEPIPLEVQERLLKPLLSPNNCSLICLCGCYCLPNRTEALQNSDKDVKKKYLSIDGKTFKKSSSVWSLKDYKCEACEKTFTQCHSLRTHERPVEAAPDIPATAATGTPITIPTPVSEVATAPEDRAAVTAPRQTTE